MANSKQEKWQQATIRRIFELDKAIEIPSNQGKTKDPYALPYEQVWEYTPAQGLDERYAFPLQIAGSEISIQLQASFGKFLHDVLGRRLGYLVRFEDFWKQWSEKGFSWTINRKGTSNLKSNYPLKDTKYGDREVPGWRVDKDTRPGYLEWKNPNKNVNPYYRIIEYWPDRSNEAESYVLVGSDSQIIQHIVTIEYRGVSSQKQRINYSSTEINRSKYPLIEIWFKEFSENGEFGKNMYKWRLRLIGTTVGVEADKSKLPKWINHEPLTEARIKEIAKNIIKAYQVDKPALAGRFMFRRGKKVFVYKDNNGMFNKGYCLDEAEAKKLVSSFCEILDVEPDWTKLTIKATSDESKAFPEKEEEITILGKNIDKPIKRPKNKVIFWEATMCLPYLPTFLIADWHGNIFTKLPDPLPILEKT